MQELFIDTPEALAAFCACIEHSEWLALDTEFIRERTYYPRLCLLQICNGQVAACIDPLALSDLRPLLDILFNGRILKVFHAARQDLEIFLHDWQQLPLPLFDTQPAAALLGYGDQIGYARLVKEILGVDLPKDHSRTDWSRRPLDPEQQRYALDDVIYLGRIYTRMRGKLSERDRLQWLVEDFAELANPASYHPDPDNLWKRIKGRQKLHGKKLAVLQRLAVWREQQAMQRNLPRRWLLKDEVLVELARRQPKDDAQLAAIRGLEPGSIKRHGEALLQIIGDSQKIPARQWPKESQAKPSLTVQQQAMSDLLSAALRLIADRQQLSPHAIANRKQLEKLVRGDPDCELLKGWRKKVAGDSLQDIARGKAQLRHQDGQLRIE